MQLENRNGVLLISLLSSTYGNYHHYLLPSKTFYGLGSFERNRDPDANSKTHQQIQKTLGINCHTTDSNTF